MADEDEPRSLTSSPSPSSSGSHNPLSGVGKALRRIHSGGSHDYSKLGSKKNGDPMAKEKKERKRGSLFKKRTTTSHDPIMEYKEIHPPSASQGSPLLSSPANRKLPSSILEHDQEPHTSPRMAVKRLTRPASSPRLVRTMEKAPLTEKLSGPPSTSPLTSQSFEKPQPGETSLKFKRRPPPPPPPYQKTYPRRAAEEVDLDPIVMKVIPPDDEREEAETLPVKPSSSMEDLLRNLEEFDELASPSPLNEAVLGVDQGERDFATIPRNELPPKFDSSDSSPDLQSRHTTGSSAPQKPPRKRSKKKPEPPSEPPLPPPKSPPQSRLESTTTSSPEGRESPVPQPPPRRKSRKGTSERKDSASPAVPAKPLSLSREKQSPLLSSRNSPMVPPKPGKPAPLPPPKPSGLSKAIPAWRVSLEKPVCSSAPVSRTVSPEDGRLSPSARETSVSTDLLTSSPVVMRRTNAVNASLDPDFSDEELEECTVSM